MRSLKRTALIALSVFFITQGVASAESEARSPEFERARVIAQEKELWEEPFWHKLVHYRKRGKGFISLAGGQRLFISPEGATNPRAELLATLVAFEENSFLEQREGFALCEFPARWRWLKSQLNLTNEDVPKIDCDERERWREELNPTSATLVFPDAYISSPGSMFGHTLLRINGADAGGRTGLLAYAINYAADVRGVGPVAYAIKGLTGGFPGFFGVFPYYTKVKEYAWIEHRDIWEYGLDLSEDELERVLEHVWELRLVPFKYFFFNRNCSWQLLALLEIARPNLSLTDGLDLYAIPVDTVRRLQQHGLITQEPVLRPSRQRELDAVEQQLGKKEKKWTRELVAGLVEPNAEFFSELSRHQQVVVLNTAFELLHSRFRRGEFSRSEALPRAHRLLLARSKLGVEKLNPIVEQVTSPDKAHPSARLQVGGGGNEFGNWLGLRVRPAFHDLLDPDEGFLPGYGINFAELALRYYNEDRKVRIESLTVLEATSRNVWTSWNKPMSWRLGVGVKRPEWFRGFEEDPDVGAYSRVEGGVSIGGSKQHVFAGVAIDGHWGDLANESGRVASGLRLGARMQFASSIFATVEAADLYSIAGLDADSRTLEVAVHAQISSVSGVRARWYWAEVDLAGSRPTSTEASISWVRYF